VQWDAIWVTSDSTVEFVLGGLAENVAHAESKIDAMMSPRK
jgi:hypothetical protein